MKPSMKRGGLWAAGVVALLGVGLLAGAQGYAQGAEDDSEATCSEATLHGTYLFAFNGVEIREDEQGDQHHHAPFAVAGHEVFDGKGEVTGVVSRSVEGEISRNESTSGAYSVNDDCTGTLRFRDRVRHYDLFIAPDGSMLTFIRTDPGFVASGFELQGTAQRVGD